MKLLYRAIGFLARKGMLNWMPDRAYLSLMYWRSFGKRLDLDHPVTFNEKLQWLKLYERNPLYAKLVDKYEVKQYVAEKIGAQYVVPTLGVWNSFDEIDFDALPDRFVLKCTHDSGGVVVCRDKATFDVSSARKKINEAMRRNYYYLWREWPYKFVKPRVIAEQYLGSDKALPVDYKCFCFHGFVDNVMLCLDRESGHPRFVHMDTNWNRLDYQWDEPQVEVPEKPAHFEEMLTVVKKLSEGMKHVRVDMYCVDDRIYFGEYTFFDQSGLDMDITYATDKAWGALIEL